MSQLISRRSISRLHNFYCTGKHHMTSAKRMFMFFNVFLHFSATNYRSAFYHMTCTAPEATNAKSLDAYFFSLSFLLLFTLSFFAIYSKASSLPVSLMRLHISLFRHLQFSTLVESMLRNYPHRRLIPMIMSVCNRTK